ncbi:MAG: IS200/IS605 family transposase [Spirochaetales bacterium]|nr:IS200/IS605 family transposase [Spirochaetales bacterium]
MSFRRAENIQSRWKIEYMEADEDHVHFFISTTPTDCIADIVHSLKQTSTYDMWKSYYSYLRKFYWKEHHLWTRGYFCSSAGNVCAERLKKYIMNQG